MRFLAALLALFTILPAFADSVSDVRNADARLVTVTGGAHAMWLDDPVTTFGAIRHFLRGDRPIGSEKVSP